MSLRANVQSLVVLAGLAAGQQSLPVKVHVGDPIVRGAVLKPYKNLWRMSIIRPDGTRNLDVGTWGDQLQFVTIDGHKHLKRTQIATFKKNGVPVATTTTMNVFDRKTLAPISRSFSRHMLKGGEEEGTEVEFGKNLIRWSNTKGGKTTSKDVPLRSKVFDFYGGLYGILIATLPLESGFSASLPSIDEQEPTVSTVSFTVTGQETVDAGPLGKANTFVVVSNTNLGPMKFWLSRQAPYIIRLEYKAKDNGTTWVYQMI